MTSARGNEDEKWKILSCVVFGYASDNSLQTCSVLKPPSAFSRIMDVQDCE